MPGQQSRYGWPSYDVQKLAAALNDRKSGRTLAQARFYTGVPTIDQDLYWHKFWTNKTRKLLNDGIYVYKGSINADGEKGVDVSIGTDLVDLTYSRSYEVAIMVCQDKDLGPAVALSKRIAKDQGRQLAFESAFPFELGKKTYPRGVPGTEWFQMSREFYDACHDPMDYR